jgi:dipeptidyl aminopeptidase/acylaminoacyl peptidase
MYTLYVRVRTTALVALVVTALALPAHADDVFTPWHVNDIRVASSAVPSPDGSQVAYVLAVPRNPFEEPDGPAWEELRVVATAGGPSVPFVAGHVNVREPRWLPDGRAISFLAKRAGDSTRSLYVISTDGGEARRVLTFETDIRSYAWSPDGRDVAFVAEPKKADARVALEKKGFTQEVFEETLEHARVWIARAGDEEPAKPRQLALDGHATQAHWSPDGRRLAVVLAPTPLVDHDLMQRRVHVVDVAQGRVLASLQNPGKLDRVAWSPDGRSLAIVSGEDLNDPAAGRLLVRPAEGEAGWTDIIPAYEGHVRDFAWTDAETIVFIGDEGVETVIGQVRRDGTGRRTLVPAGRAIFTAIEASPSGVLAFQADAPRHAPEVYAARLAGDGLSPQRLTDSNPWLARMRFAPQEVVTFKARDGLELQGILVRPLDERQGQRYPLILTVHGGPEAHDRNGWRTGYANPGQFGAAAGFAVFYPNYRGSTGRGVAFSKLGQADAAGKEFDDLVDAVDHLVNVGLVDTKRVGITGGSYGGYATAWSSTYYTERFAAGVMFVGISNKISKIGTTDIADEEYLVHARERVWDNWQFFLERSPIYHAAKSRTPLLIMHGKDDPRVHPTQSLELYRHLKLHGKTPVRLVWYPGEGHGNRRAASRLDYSLRMLRWFEHYLQGPGGEPPAPEIEYERLKTGQQTTAAQ